MLNLGTFKVHFLVFDLCLIHCRPNDFFLEQIVELDNDLRKQRECNIPRNIHLRGLDELEKLAKPWHYEFWSEIPDDLPFSLIHMPIPNAQKMGLSSKCASKRASMISNESSDWEWEYYSDSEAETDQTPDHKLISEE